MEKIKRDIQETVLNVQLFRDDVQSIIEILLHDGRKVGLEIDDWKLTGEEFSEFHQQATAQEIVFRSTPIKGGQTSLDGEIFLTVSEGHAFVEVYTPTVESEGLLRRVLEAIRRAVVPSHDPERMHWHDGGWDTIVFSYRSIQPRIASIKQNVPSPAEPPPPTANTSLPAAIPAAPSAVIKQPVHELKVHAAKQLLSSLITWALAGTGAVAAWIWHKLHSAK